MRYTPGYTEDSTTSTDKTYTFGDVYMKKSGDPYTGYYHTRSGIPYSGIKENDESVRLYEITTNATFIEYLNLKDGIYYDNIDPTSMTIFPTEKDYLNGYMIRYFIKKRNDINSIVYEVDKKTYDSMGVNSSINIDLYYSVFLKWKITGPVNDIHDDSGSIKSPGVIDTNEKTINEYKKQIPGIENILSNLTQFYKYI